MENTSLYPNRTLPSYGATQSSYEQPPSHTQQSPIIQIEEQGPIVATAPNTQNVTPAQVTQATSPSQLWGLLARFPGSNKKSAGPASLILVTGGMNIAWSCGFVKNTGFYSDTHLMICWYIAAIVGALIGAFINNRMTKKPIYLFSGFLALIAGILIVALPHKYGAIAAARYLNGFGVGLIFVQMLILIGEQLNSNVRGSAAAVLEMTDITIGIYLQIILIAVYEIKSTYPNHKDTFGSIQFHGVVAIIFSILTIITSYILVIESPIYYLLRNDETQAIDCLRRLQPSPNNMITEQTYRLLEEHKRYIETNTNSSSVAGASDLGLFALLKLCLYRGFISLSFSPFVTAVLQISTLAYAGPDAIYPLYIFGALLFLGTLISACLMDWLGRKMIMLIGALVCGGLAIGIGSIFNDLMNVIFNINMGKALSMLFAMEFFAGFFRSSSSAYLTEAFPLNLKPYYIALSFSVEMFVLLIIGTCSINENSFGAYFITFGVFYLIFFVLGILFLPETKKLTLTEAQDKFKNVLNINL